MRSPLARITGADKSEGGNLPLQQVSSMGRVGDATIVHPYGLYADLPNNTLVYMIAPGVAVPCNIQNPDDSERGEPVFFHPTTKTRIIARNNGDLDIVVGAGGGNVNITCVDANITASGSATIDTPETTITGNLQVDGDFNCDGAASLGGGGPAIARVGDSVAGGVITSGSSTHTAS